MSPSYKHFAPDGAWQAASNLSKRGGNSAAVALYGVIVAFPGDSVASPIITVASPRVTVATPDATVASPRLTVAFPHATVAFPRDAGGGNGATGEGNRKTGEANNARICVVFNKNERLKQADESKSVANRRLLLKFAPVFYILRPLNTR